MSLAITGATGLVGRFFVEEALDRGEPVTVLGRIPPPAGFYSAPVAFRPYRLGDRPDLSGHDAVIHCAFSHVPGRYRGGEGDDPDGFAHSNLQGSVALFGAAKASGVSHLLFLSSRAVYGGYPPGTLLTEEMPPRPDTLYGEVKWQAEQALFALAGDGFTVTSLRATGVYGPAGPGQRHKWADLFDDFRAGREIAPRRGTELHGDDLAAAARLIRATPTEQVSGRAFNLSDIVLDRHDLFELVARAARLEEIPLPPRSDAPVSEMCTARLRGLGWKPGGIGKLRSTVPTLI